MTAKLKPMTVSSFALGMNTRRPDFELRKTQPPYGRFMREIVNCDIVETALKRRRGYARVLTAAAGSLWGDDAQAYFASGSSLMSLTDVAGTLVSAVVSEAVLAASAPVSFATAPMGGAYWTDGVTLGYANAGVSASVAPPQPTVVPAVTTGAGSLDAGIYSYVFTYVDSVGRESAATHPVSVTLGDASSLVFTMGTPTLPGYTLKVSVSLPNGIEMYSALLFTSTGAQSVTTISSFGAACTTVGLINMPAGRFVRYNNGRLMVVVGSTLFYSRPYSSGLFDPTSDFIPFPAPITVLECLNGEGTYIVADQTYWFGGDIADTKPIAISPVPGVMGSGCARPETGDVAWMSARGIALGGSGGKVELPQDENVTVGLTTLGASTFIERDGAKQVITTLLGTALSAQAEGSLYSSGALADSATAFDAWLVNPETGASRRYSNYAFTSFAQIAGRYYGAKADGIYLLEGDTDAGTAITASINPGRQNFGSPMRKRMEAAYLTVGTTAVAAIAASTGAMCLTIADDQANSYDYETRRDDTVVQQQRIDVGRGLNGNYLSFRLTNVTGCAFELTTLELFGVEATRRLAG
jgi:hypothetical protein